MLESHPKKEQRRMNFKEEQTLELDLEEEGRFQLAEKRETGILSRKNSMEKKSKGDWRD
jgi:hypothetical protein